MVSERQVDHREVRPVEDRSAGLQRLVDLFLLELLGGTATSWHVDASRRIGVSVGVSSVLSGLLQIDRKLKSVTRGAAGLRFMWLFFFVRGVLAGSDRSYFGNGGSTRKERGVCYGSETEKEVSHLIDT